MLERCLFAFFWFFNNSYKAESFKVEAAFFTNLIDLHMRPEKFILEFKLNP